MVTGEESLAVKLLHWNRRILAIAVDVTMPVATIAAVTGRALPSWERA
jgi:hypothetical protein